MVLPHTTSLKYCTFTPLVGLSDRAFAIAAPKFWNALPLQITKSFQFDIFHFGLKMHLFGLAFNTV